MLSDEEKEAIREEVRGADKTALRLKFAAAAATLQLSGEDMPQQLKVAALSRAIALFDAVLERIP